MSLRAAAVAAIAALTFIPASAAANATPAEVAALAASAVSDPHALATLRAIDHVNGRPVDLAAALDAADPQLTERLHTLAATADRSTTTPANLDPRATASRILSEKRFTGSSVPQPLHGPLQWLGRRLHSLYDAIVRPLPGGGRFFWLLVAAAVAGLAALAVVRLTRRSAGRLVDRNAKAARSPVEDPRRLERDADEAERNGDLERALRLRFRAGLIRLARSDAIPERTSLTNGEIARRIESRSFHELAIDFDEVVYGRRKTAAVDLTRARNGWPRVLEEAERR